MVIVSGLFAVFCTLVLPIGAAVFLMKYRKGLWKPILVGTATFLVFQILFRLPILQLVLPKMGWFLVMSSAQPILYSLFLGATAGLVEEFGRYITMRIFLKKSRQPLDGIGFGIGHGGIEAVLLVGINALATLIVSSQSIVPSLTFASGVERLAAMTFHIGWSVMVMKSVREKKPVWLFVAFLTHTAMDTGVSVASFYHASTWMIEVVLVLLALPTVCYIIKQYRKPAEKSLI